MSERKGVPTLVYPCYMSHHRVLAIASWLSNRLRVDPIAHRDTNWHPFQDTKRKKKKNTVTNLFWNFYGAVLNYKWRRWPRATTTTAKEKKMATLKKDGGKYVHSDHKLNAKWQRFYKSLHETWNFPLNGNKSQ